MELIRKDLDFEIKQVGEPKDRVLEFIGSTATVDRYGDIIDVEGWELANFKKNPQFLWAHSYHLPPVGTARKVFKTDKALVFHVYFFTDEEIHAQGYPDSMPTPETVYRLYLNGALRATSVGFRDLEREPIYGDPQGESGWRPVQGYRYKRQELYELSAVTVPANPDAVMMAVQKGIISPQEAEKVMEADNIKGAIPYKAYPTDDEGAAWDGPGEMKKAEISDCKKICTWVDPDKADVKGGYKLPHHRAEGYNTVWRGVAAAMAALLGARGGVQIPDEDRKAVYNHLVKHYAQFDKKPPEFKDYGDLELTCIESGFPPIMAKVWQESCALMVQEEMVRQQNAIALILKAEVQEAVRDALEHFLADKTITDWYSQPPNPGKQPEGGGQAREQIDNLIDSLSGIKKLL